jgi:hypothetical protein
MPHAESRQGRKNLPACRKGRPFVLKTQIGHLFRPYRDLGKNVDPAPSYPRMNPWAIACRLSEAPNPSWQGPDAIVTNARCHGQNSLVIDAPTFAPSATKLTNVSSFSIGA